MNILLVDDEKSLRVALADELTDAGYAVATASCGEQALTLMAQTVFDLVITDLVMDGVSGIEVMREAKTRHGATEVILITAHATLDTAIEAVKGGAFDYLCKPFDPHVLLCAVRSIREVLRLREENRLLHRQLRDRHSFRAIVGKSAAMQKVFSLLDIVSESDKTVMVTGETGTGKQMVAEAIHYNGKRADKPFVTVSCAALARDVLESELFGHERGAFTGAVREKRGRFELADGGTLFLDEIDDAPLETQVKFLQAIETGRFERVGGEQTIAVDVRIIAASKQDLEELVQAGKFRKDLYYRLNVIQIPVPALRERKEDIPLLVEHFLAQCSPPRSLEFSASIMGHLLQYNWEGNVRELKHVIERLVLLARDGRVDPDALPEKMRRVADCDCVFEPGSISLPEYLAAIERNALVKALTVHDGNKARVAETLGIPLPTLKSKLQRFGL